MNPDKQLLLDQLRADILKKDVCHELAETAKNLVLGSGNVNAQIVCIGEAPGKKEDESGLPFVGASGKFLNEMLEMVHLKRDDIYITNIVKYRPPNNRDPTKAEKAAFTPYLVRQLEIIQPTIIVTLGRHSMEYFLPDVKIGDVHGTVIQKTIIGSQGQKYTWQIVPLYHPAAALYNGSLRQTLLDDFQSLTTILDS